MVANYYTFGTYDASSCFNQATGCDFYKISVQTSVGKDLAVCVSPTPTGTYVFTGEILISGANVQSVAPATASSSVACETPGGFPTSVPRVHWDAVDQHLHRR